MTCDDLIALDLKFYLRMAAPFGKGPICRGLRIRTPPKRDERDCYNAHSEKDVPRTDIILKEGGLLGYIYTYNIHTYHPDVDSKGLDLHEDAKAAHHKATDPALPQAPEVGHVTGLRRDNSWLGASKTI